MDAIETYTVGRYTVRIMQDTDPASPREWDNLGTMVCWHRNYALGDKQVSASDPQAFRTSPEYKDAAIILPLYLYDHSGITMRAGRNFADIDPGQWDSGQVGYIFVTRAKLREEYSVKRVSKRVLAKACEVLQGEVRTYDQYLTGDVYGYILEENGENVDSCWGFYGLDYCKEQARGIAESWNVEAAKIDKLQLDTL